MSATRRANDEAPGGATQELALSSYLKRGRVKRRTRYCCARDGLWRLARRCRRADAEAGAQAVRLALGGGPGGARVGKASDKFSTGGNAISIPATSH